MTTTVYSRVETRLSLPTPQPLHYTPIRNPHITKYIKRGKYKIFRAQSYIRSPNNKLATIAGKNINSDTTQHMIGALQESDNGNK
jgi:hypothetical protein